MLIKFFSACGPITYCRLAGEANQPARYAFIEFAEAEGWLLLSFLYLLFVVIVIVILVIFI